MTSANVSSGSSAALQGAAAGAAVGSIVPGVGTVTGAVVGAIIGGISGGVFGGIAGSSANKAKRYQRKAEAVQMERESNQVEDMYLQMIRQARQTRAASVAGSTYAGISTSSLSTSALSSIGSQLGYGMQYTAEDQRLFNLYSQYMQKAGKAASHYKSMMSAWKEGTQAVTYAAMAYSAASAAAAEKEALQKAAEGFTLPTKINVVSYEAQASTIPLNSYAGTTIKPGYIPY